MERREPAGVNMAEERSVCGGLADLYRHDTICQVPRIERTKTKGGS